MFWCLLNKRFIWIPTIWLVFLMETSVAGENYLADQRQAWILFLHFANYVLIKPVNIKDDFDRLEYGVSGKVSALDVSCAKHSSGIPEHMFEFRPAVFTKIHVLPVVRSLLGSDEREEASDEDDDFWGSDEFTQTHSREPIVSPFNSGEESVSDVFAPHPPIRSGRRNAVQYDPFTDDQERSDVERPVFTGPLDRECIEVILSRETPYSSIEGELELYENNSDGEECDDLPVRLAQRQISRAVRSERLESSERTSLEERLYRDSLQRFGSLSHWRGPGNISRQRLANAGFYQNVRGRDMVSCFFCNLRLYNFQITDDPVQEHLRHGPDCEHIQRILRYLIQRENRQ